MDLANRVASRYLRAADDEAAFETMVNHWLDEFLDEFTGRVQINESDIEQVLRSQGVSADDVNRVSEDAGLGSVKTAGFGNLVRALGGVILKGAWHMIAGPFIGVAKLIKSSQFRTEVRASFRRALSHEIRSTKHMISVAGRIARHEPVNPNERKAAMHQLVDILVKVLIVYFAGPHVAHLFAGGIWKAMAALLSPIDEILVILLDKPIRAATKKLMSADIGLMPSGFYTHFAYDRRFQVQPWCQAVQHPPACRSPPQALPDTP